MTGLPEFNRPAFFKAAARLEKKGCKVLNPARIGDLPEYDMYWPINEAMLEGADAIYLLKGWEASEGASREARYAYVLGLSVMLEDDDA
jgi:hypothetical protein